MQSVGFCEEYCNRGNQGDHLKFDYVIVGAGSAGCVLANRLTQDRNTMPANVLQWVPH